MARVVIIARTLRESEHFRVKLSPAVERTPLLLSINSSTGFLGMRKGVVFLVGITLLDIPTDWRYTLLRDDIKLIRVVE